MNTRFRLSIFFSMIFPLIFIGVFGLAFQQSDPGNTTITISYINYDVGIPNEATVYGQDGSIVEGRDLSMQFVNVLKSVKYEDNSTHIFELKEYDPSDLNQAIEDVERRKNKALLKLPTDFSLGVMAAMQNYLDLNGADLTGYPNPEYHVNLTLQGDASLLDFAIVNTVMDQIVDIYFKLGSNAIVGANLHVEGTFSSEGFTNFDYIVPGLVIFAIINNLSTIATISLTDVKSRLLDRFRLSNMSSWEYPLSLILSQLALSIIQIPVMFAAAIMFGFPMSFEILYAYIFAILVSLSLSGMGLLIASIAKDEKSVGGLASLIATPMAFLAGAFFQMPNPTIVSNGSFLGDHKLGIFDLLPPRTAIDTLRLVLINGWPLSSLVYEIVLLGILTLFYLSVGVFTYSRKHLSTH
jgi:ABC-2 type transport system permease protein